MNPEIPPTVESESAAFHTRNRKEAAILYALADVEPIRTADGKCYVFRARVKQPGARDFGQAVTWFGFSPGARVKQIHAAMADPNFEAQHAAEIPEELVPVFVAWMKRVFHNYERCGDIANAPGPVEGVPLHGVVVSKNKIRIAAV